MGVTTPPYGWTAKVVQEWDYDAALKYISIHRLAEDGITATYPVKLEENLVGALWFSTVKPIGLLQQYTTQARMLFSLVRPRRFAVFLGFQDQSPSADRSKPSLSSCASAKHTHSKHMEEQCLGTRL